MKSPHRQYFLRILVFGFFAVLPVVTNAGSGGAVLIKGGTMALADDSQTVDSKSLNLDPNSNRTFAVNIEGRMRNGVALGAEYLTYHHDFKLPSLETGTAETKIVQFLAKKYFIEDGLTHPYLGIGLGLSHARVSSSTSLVSDFDFAFAAQLLLGIELRFDNLSLLAEIKHMYYDIAGGGKKYDPTATGIFVGMGFNW